MLIIQLLKAILYILLMNNRKYNIKNYNKKE